MSTPRPVLSRRLASLTVGAVLLVGCPDKTPPQAVIPAGHAPSAGVISVQLNPELAASAAAPRGPSPSEQAVLAVLDAARERAVSCYAAALERDPRLYGEVVIKLELDVDGGIVQAGAILDTLGDRDMVGCVERLVQAQRFPAPGVEGYTLRYPFLFSTDHTPLEVVRAMKAQHGLIEEEPAGLDLETIDGGATRHGTVETW
jgi:hypothetical protein